VCTACGKGGLAKERKAKSDIRLLREYKAYKETEAREEATVQLMAQSIRDRFPTMQEELATAVATVIKTTTDTNATDAEVAAKTSQAVASSSSLPGLDTKYVSVGGVVYTLHSWQWDEVSKVIGDQHGKKL
jgi:hypothetical protein